MEMIRMFVELEEADRLGLNREEALELFLQNFAHFPPEALRETKDEDMAEMYRSQANSQLNRGLYQDAVKNYTKSLQMSMPYSKSASICFANRSLALFHLEAYEESKADLERALQLPNSISMKKDFLKRKQKLTLILKGHPNQVKSRLQSDKRTMENLQLAHGENPEIPGASNGIALAYTPQFGRHFVATKPIKAGDVLLIQEPYVSIISEMSEKSERCHHCLKECMAPIPCDFCTSALYCSEKCRRDAHEKDHRIRCKLSGRYMFLDEIQMQHFQVQMKLLMIVTDQGKAFKKVKEEMEEIEKCKDPKTTGFTGDQLLGCSSKALLSLLGHKDEKKNPALAYSAAMMAVLLKNNTDFSQGEEIDVPFLAKLILHLNSVFQMNLVMLRGKHSTDLIAYGMYPVFNMLNHSCVSNTFSYTHKGNIRVLRAFRDIKPGEQVFTNYINHQTLIFTAKERKQFLMEFKYFKCHCLACDHRYSFKPEVKGKLEVPMKLKRKLRQFPNKIECMWELLGIMIREIPQPCSEVEIMRYGLMDAYMGSKNDLVLTMYRNIGIL